MLSILARMGLNLLVPTSHAGPRRRSLAAERRYSGYHLRNRVMPKRSQPRPSPTEAEEEPVWGDLFGFVHRPPPNPTPIGDTPTSPPPSKRQQPKTPRKPSTKRGPPGGGASR